VVLMDIQMPVMDGREATQLIRKEEETAGRRRLPILAMTANVLPADRDRALASGMDDLIPKPFDTDDLLRRLREALSRTGDGRSGA
jgi:two-component system sensor histidine kinase/response regulator